MQYTNPITSHREDYDKTIERISPNRKNDDINTYRSSPNRNMNS